MRSTHNCPVRTRVDSERLPSKRLRARGLLALLFAMFTLFALVPSVTAAQDSVGTSYTRAFQARRWAAEFAFDRDFASLGVLRFRSGRTAWLLSARIELDRSDASQVGTMGEERRWWTVAVDSRLGRRTYRPLVGRAVAFYGLGATAGWSGGGVEGESEEAPRRAQWRVGVFGELGVAYRVTPRFSLGLSRSLQATYRRGSLNDAVQRDTKSRSWKPRLWPAQLSGTLYF